MKWVSYKYDCNEITDIVLSIFKNEFRTIKRARPFFKLVSQFYQETEKVQNERVTDYTQSQVTAQYTVTGTSIGSSMTINSSLHSN